MLSACIAFVFGFF